MGQSSLEDSLVRTRPIVLARTLIMAMRESPANLDDHMETMAEFDRLGDEVMVPAFEFWCQSEDVDMRLGSAYFLLFAGVSSPTAIETFRKSLSRRRPPAERRHALVFLAQLSLSPTSLIVPLTRLIRETSQPGLAVLAACAIDPAQLTNPDDEEKLPPVATIVEVHDLLLKGIADPESAVSTLATVAMARLGQRDSQSLQPILALLESDDPEHLFVVINLVSTLVDRASVFTPRLTRLACDRNRSNEVRLASIHALYKLGVSEADCDHLRASLNESVDDNTQHLSMMTAAVLRNTSSDDSLDVSSLTQRLHSADVSEQIAAAQSLGEIACHSPEALSQIIAAACVEKTPAVYLALVKAIARADCVAIPPLLDLLQTPDIHAHQVAMTSLTALGGQASKPLAEQLLTHPDPIVRATAVGVLQTLGPEAAGAVPAIIEILQRAEASLHLDALRALERIGPSARDAISAVVPFWLQSDSLFQRSAERALIQIGIEIVPVLEHLKSSVSDQQKARIDRLLERFGILGTITGQGGLAWVNNDHLLKLYVFIGQELQKELKSNRRLVLAVKNADEFWSDIKTKAATESGLRQNLEKLEDIIARHEGRSVFLRERSGRHRGGLSADGVEFLRRAKHYLQAIGKLP